MNFLKALFPTLNDRNITLYYFLSIFMNGWFILRVFYFARYISLPQIGFIFGISKIFGLLLEVPSGAISDLVGKKKTLIMAQLFLIASALLFIYSKEFNQFLIANVLMTTGFSFISGSKEAILYDSLLEKKQETSYDEILGKSNSIALITTAITTIIGGFIFKFNPTFTFVAYTIFNFITLIILLFMYEPNMDSEKISYKLYFHRLRDGVTSIFKQPFFSFVLPVLFISMFIQTYQGVVIQNTGMLFGFTGETYGYLLGLAYIPTAITAYNFKNILSKFGEKKVEIIFIIFYLLSFLSAIMTNNIIVGVAIFFTLHLCDEIAKPYFIRLVNKNTSSEHRATAISTVSLFSEFPNIILTVFFASMLELANLKYLYIIFVGLLAAYLLISNCSNKKISQILVE